MHSVILAKIDKIEKLLKALRKDLEQFNNENEVLLSGIKQKPESKLTNNPNYVEDFNGLYSEYHLGNVKKVEEYVNMHNKKELTNFCKINNLPIEVSKTSKTNILKAIYQWMKQSEIITK